MSAPVHVAQALASIAVQLASMARAQGQDEAAAQLEQLAGDVARGEPTATPLPDDRLWTQREACTYLGVSARYLRESSCPKILLPGTGPKGQNIVRYSPADVRAWAEDWRAGRLARTVRKIDSARERGRVA